MENDKDFNAKSSGLEPWKAKDKDLVEPLDVLPPQALHDEVKRDLTFVERLEDATIEIAKNATADEDYIRVANKKMQEVVDQKIEIERQRQQLESQVLDLKSKVNEYEAIDKKYLSRLSSQSFYHKSLAPIIQDFGHIERPMTVWLQVIIAILLFPFYLVYKLAYAVFGNLFFGATNTNRGKLAKGFFWTVLIAIVIFLIVIATWFALKLFNII